MADDVVAVKAKRTSEDEFLAAVCGSTSYAEAAAKLGVSTGAVATRLAKYRKIGVVLGNFKRGGHRKLNADAINAKVALLTQQKEG